MGRRKAEQTRGLEDLLFFLLQVKRKQSGKWSVRAVSRRGAVGVPRLPASRLTRTQRLRSRRPRGQASPAPARRAETGKRSPLAASGEVGERTKAKGFGGALPSRGASSQGSPSAHDGRALSLRAFPRLESPARGVPRAGRVGT